MFLVASKWTSTSHPPTPANNAQMHPRNRLGYGRLEQQCAGGSIGRVRRDVGAHCGHSGFALLSKAEGRVAGQLGRTRELFDWHGVRTLGGFDEADSDVDAISGMFRGDADLRGTAQSEPYATTGVLSWGTAFSALWLPPSTTMDWTQGVDRVAVILKDTENNKPSADNVGDAEAARYTPTRVRMVVTVVTQGSTYVPPGPYDAGAPAKDSGTDARSDSGAPAKDSGSDARSDSGADTPPGPDQDSSADAPDSTGMPNPADSSADSSEATDAGVSRTPGGAKRADDDDDGLQCQVRSAIRVVPSRCTGASGSGWFATMPRTPGSVGPRSRRRPPPVTRSGRPARMSTGARASGLAPLLSLVLFARLNQRPLLHEDGGVSVLILSGVWTLFMPLGDRYSLDAIRRDAAGEDAALTETGARAHCTSAVACLHPTRKAPPPFARYQKIPPVRPWHPPPPPN